MFKATSIGGLKRRNRSQGTRKYIGILCFHLVEKNTLI